MVARVLHAAGYYAASGYMLSAQTVRVYLLTAPACVTTSCPPACLGPAATVRGRRSKYEVEKLFHSACLYAHCYFAELRSVLHTSRQHNVCRYNASRQRQSASSRGWKLTQTSPLTVQLRRTAAERLCSCVRACGDLRATYCWLSSTTWKLLQGGSGQISRSKNTTDPSR